MGKGVPLALLNPESPSWLPFLRTLWINKRNGAYESSKIKVWAIFRAASDISGSGVPFALVKPEEILFLLKLEKS